MFIGYMDDEDQMGGRFGNTEQNKQRDLGMASFDFYLGF